MEEGVKNGLILFSLAFALLAFSSNVLAVEAKIGFNSTGNGLEIIAVNSPDFFDDDLIISLDSCKIFLRGGSCRSYETETSLLGEGTLHLNFERTFRLQESRNYFDYEVRLKSLNYGGEEIKLKSVRMKYLESRNVIYQRFYGEEFNVRTTYYKHRNETRLVVFDRNEGSYRETRSGEVDVFFSTNDSKIKYLIS